MSLAERIAKMPVRHDNGNPLWAGPGAPGPLGGVTQSMIGRFLSCRERFRLKYVLGLEPFDRWNHRLGYGNMWHVCEEAFAAAPGDKHPKEPHELWMWEDKLNQHAREMISQYPLQREEIDKWYNVCCVQFPEYVQYWAQHPDVLNRTPLLQEEVFDVPYTLPSGRTVRLRGRWDSVDLVDGGIYLQENKTKGDIDKEQIERQLSFDLQTMMYIVALKKATIYPNGVKGVRYNVIRRPLSGGKGNIRPHAAKSTKGTYTPPETAEQFYERLRHDYIAAEPDYWFFRVRAEISERDVQVFRQTCLDPILEQMCTWYDFHCRKLPPGLCVLPPNALSYRHPFGVYNALEESGSTEYDAYLATGSEAGLRRTEELFTELK